MTWIEMIQHSKAEAIRVVGEVPASYVFVIGPVDAVELLRELDAPPGDAASTYIATIEGIEVHVVCDVPPKAMYLMDRDCVPHKLSPAS